MKRILTAGMVALAAVALAVGGCGGGGGGTGSSSSGGTVSQQTRSATTTAVARVNVGGVLGKVAHSFLGGLRATGKSRGAGRGTQTWVDPNTGDQYTLTTNQDGSMVLHVVFAAGGSLHFEMGAPQTSGSVETVNFTTTSTLADNGGTMTWAGSWQFNQADESMIMSGNISGSINAPELGGTVTLSGNMRMSGSATAGFQYRSSLTATASDNSKVTVTEAMDVNAQGQGTLNVTMTVFDRQGNSVSSLTITVNTNGSATLHLTDVSGVEIHLTLQPDGSGSGVVKYQNQQVGTIAVNANGQAVITWADATTDSLNVSGLAGVSDQPALRSAAKAAAGL